MPRAKIIDQLVARLHERRPLRTTSLIVSLFGDVVSQHGGTIWLGSLIRALEPMGINERLVRTSVFRLAQDGWLECERVGRRSYYRFSDFANNEYERAARSVYALEREPWHGRWQFLIPVAIAGDRLERLKRSLHWQGFRQIAAGAFARPGEVDGTLQESLEDLEVIGSVVLMQSEMSSLTSFGAVRKLVEEHWQLDKVGERYREFLSRYQQLARFLQKPRPLDPESAFVARTLLIHDYRRALLLDTPLPQELLPPVWLGHEALKLTSELYLALAPASITFITAELESGNGPMPGPRDSFRNRFAHAPAPG